MTDDLGYGRDGILRGYGSLLGRLGISSGDHGSKGLEGCCCVRGPFSTAVALKYRKYSLVSLTFTPKTTRKHSAKPQGGTYSHGSESVGGGLSNLWELVLESTGEVRTDLILVLEGVLECDRMSTNYKH